MNYLLYHSVQCHSCRDHHNLYLALEDDRPEVRSVRYECPNSRMIVGERLKGHADQTDELRQGWIECLPVYASGSTAS